MKKTEKLRELINRKEILVVPGGFSPIVGMIAEQLYCGRQTVEPHGRPDLRRFRVGGELLGWSHGIRQCRNERLSPA